MNDLNMIGAQSAQENIDALLGSIEIPQLHKVELNFDRKRIDSIPETIDHQIEKAFHKGLISKGMEVAIAVGSRGVRNINLIVKAVVISLKRKEVSPFLVPAMGSHGGASIRGQLEILASLGVTEEFVGAPIRATTKVVEVGTTESGLPVYVDAEAYSADGNILINRIKPHTAFTGIIESGLVKMGVVGLGKQPGAQCFHSQGMENMASNLLEMGKVVLKRGKILFGMAILENAYDETKAIRMLAADEILQVEPILLEEAKAAMPRLPFRDIDVLIIDQIGKDISGDSMDPNITGRFYSSAVKVKGLPTTQRIVALDITEASHGNCIGVGIADFISEDLFKKIDLSQMYMNSLTNCVLAPAKLPLVMKNSEQAIKAAIATCLHVDRNKLRVVRIKNTLSLEIIQVSEALLNELSSDLAHEIIVE